MLKPSCPELIAASPRGDVPSFIAMDVLAAAARIEAEGHRVIHMEVGQPVAPAPRAAVAAAQCMLRDGRVPYTAALGTTGLRERIARHYAEAYGATVAPDRVVVTTGSSAGFLLAFLALFEAGNRVALAIPGYPPYRHILAALGCEAVLIPTGEDSRWALTPEALLAAHREKPLRGVIVASPANPTGTMMTPDSLRDLIVAAEREGIRVVSDEIYHGLDYGFPAETAARVSENAIVINSFSKYFCMTGWRIGWMLMPPALVRTAERLQQNLAISPPTLSQQAAEAAFEGRAEMEAVKQGYAENRRILLDGLAAHGFDRILPADGAFYVYADVSRFTADSFDFARRMLEDAHVAATPGLDFDPVHGGRYLRLCYAGSADETREAVRRIGRWLSPAPKAPLHG